MGRRRIPVGGHGNISFKTLGRRKVQATCNVRDADGKLREASYIGTSKEDAKDELLKKIRLRPGFVSSELTPESIVSEAIDRWLEKLDQLVADGHRAINTPRTYRSVINQHVRPGIGALQLAEATPPRMDAFIVGMRAHHGLAVTKTARTVINKVMEFAVSKGALEANPMRDVGKVGTGRRVRKRKPRAMTQVERDDWLAKMEADIVASARDLPDLTRMLLATGCRIAECLAITFDDIDIDDKLVVISGQIIRAKGVGLLRVPPKSSAGERTLKLPGWAVDLVIRRGDRFGWKGPLFPIPAQRRGGQRWKNGVWRDPSNVSRDLRQARDEAGYAWLTSHAFRRTAATVMKEAGFTAREVADQLGHEKISMTQDHYFGREAVAHGAVAFEDMFGETT